MISGENQKLTCFKCHLKQSGLIQITYLRNFIFYLCSLQIPPNWFHFYAYFDIDIEPYVPCRYVGHLKERTLKDQMAKDPTEVIRKAVLRMLPRNKLRDVSVRILVFSLSLSPIQMLYFICLLFRTLDFLAVI